MANVYVSSSRIVMAVDIEIWWLRSLSLMMIVPFLGPQLVAIGKMVRHIPIEMNCRRNEIRFRSKIYYFSYVLLRSLCSAMAWRLVR